MKKLLLCCAMALMAGVSAFAVTDGQTYEPKNGLTCTNLWIDAVLHNSEGWNALPWMVDGFQTKARTACLGKYEGKNVILVGYSKTMIVDGVSDDYAHIVIMDFLTGEVIKTQQVTCDGQPVKGLLCANQVGFDQFGHAWIMGCAATLYSPDTGKKACNLYNVNLADGTATIAAALEVDDAAADEIGGGATRVDYWDAVGDITRENAPCSVMAAIAGGSNTWILAWTAEQGSDEFEGGMDGYMVRYMEETYPSGVSDWDTAPCVRIVLDDEYSNRLFYADGFTTCASLYTNSGTMVEGGNFSYAVDLAPAVGTNGVGEFNIGGRDFIIYSIGQYTNGDLNRARICELSDNMSFEGMESYWLLPADGLGDKSDGFRIHPVEARKYVDANGKEAAYILTYKAVNGVGVYVVAEEGFDMDNAQEEDPDEGGVADVINDNNAPVEYFNLQGVRLENPAAGQIVIRRQGTEVNKLIVK